MKTILTFALAPITAVFLALALSATVYAALLRGLLASVDNKKGFK